MPITSPSYFPPARGDNSIIGITAGQGAVSARSFLGGRSAGKSATATDLIIVGDLAGSTGLGTGVGGTQPASQLGGSILIGSNAGTNLVGIGNSAGFGNCIAIGQNALQTAAFGSGVIAIGQNTLQLTNPDITQSGYMFEGIWIGNNAGQNFAGVTAAAQPRANVVIGFNSANPSNPTTLTLTGSVIIGHEILSNYAPATNLLNNVLIGYNAAPQLVNTAGGGNGNLIAIGFRAASNITAADLSIVIGSTASSGLTLINAVTIGQSAINGGTNTIIVGAFAGSYQGNRNIGQGSVLLGYGAGAAQDTPANTFVCEQNGFIGAVGTNQNPVNSLLYGNFVSGNLLFGSIVNGGNLGFRDLENIGATNAVKLLNGTRGNAVSFPASGGFFYVVGGVLHWVSSNADLVLSPAAGQLAAATTVYSNNAAAQAGTLTNAPIAGNPTKWIPINDNGTIRNIPAW